MEPLGFVTYSVHSSGTGAGPDDGWGGAKAVFCLGWLLGAAGFGPASRAKAAAPLDSMGGCFSKQRTYEYHHLMYLPVPNSQCLGYLQV